MRQQGAAPEAHNFNKIVPIAETKRFKHPGGRTDLAAGCHPLLSYDFRMPLDDTGANALHVFAVHWRGGSHPSWSFWAARE
jgi:hypothetical protein